VPLADETSPDRAAEALAEAMADAVAQATAKAAGDPAPIGSEPWAATW
jgi:hypothetical protein